jgi:hypothetical protein
MQTFPILNPEGKLHAFEIENLLVGRLGATNIVKLIPSVRLIKKPKKFLSWWREDIFCEFELNGVHFIIEEPFGDNSRYWIGGKNPGWCSELEIIEQAFKSA